MSDVTVLYTVTGVVLAALALWAGYVLLTAEDAPDESKNQPQPQPHEKSDGRDEPTTSTRRKPVADETPPPSTVEVLAPSERAVAIAGKSAPVVVLPVMRSRLDSHSEISDGGSSSPKGDVEPSPESLLRSGPALSLTSAIGRSEPSEGPTEMSAIIDRHHLVLLADGGGQRVQNELVSGVLVNAVAAAFEADSHALFPKDPELPHRADRLRRAVLVGRAVLEGRGREKDEGLDMSRASVLAAHFAPDNRHLYIATVGRDRAYRLRGQDVAHLNKLLAAAADASRPVDTVVLETSPGDVYVFASDAAFLALGDELRAVMTSDSSIDRVAAHFVAAASREGKSTGMTAIVVRVEPPRPSATASAT